jgi:hypothetical protein
MDIFILDYRAVSSTLEAAMSPARLRFATLLLLVLAPAGNAQEPVPYDSGVTAFVGVSVVPMDREEVLPDHTVLVRQGVVVEMGPSDSVPVPAGTRVVEGLGGYLMPGLTDLHAHATDEHEFPLWLSYGVTRIQYLNAYEDLLELANSVADAEILGPTVHLCAGPVSGIQEVGEAREVVARYDEMGFDCVKPYGDLSVEAFDAVVDEARSRGIRTIGHIPRNLTWQDVLRAGPSAVAHAEEFLYSPIESVEDLERIDSLMVANDVALVATLSNYAAITRQPLFAGRMLRHPDVGAYSPVDRRYWTPERNHYVRDFSPNRVPRMRALLGFQRRLTRRLADAGVTLGLGTDAGNNLVFPGSSTHDELDELVKAGLSPYQALRAGTADAARWLGLGDRAGVVREGAVADLVLVLGNPLTDVANALLVAGVMVRGRWLSRAELDDRVARVRAGFTDERRMMALLEEAGVAKVLEWLAARARPGSAPPLRPRALNELAYQLWRIDDRLDDAIRVFEANQRLHRGWWAAHASLAEAYEAAGRPAEALAAYRRAVELKPDYREGRERIRALGG